MMKLSFCNNEVYVLNAEDWHTLRTKHRIIGELIGGNLTIPGLPLVLMPEEAILLLRNETATLLKWNKLTNPPSDADKEISSQRRQEQLQQQRAVFKRERRKQLELMIDKIVEGKKKRGRSEHVGSPEEIIEEEMSKIPDITEDTMLEECFMAHPSCSRGEPEVVPISALLDKTSRLKCAVYTDLWRRGYYITTGQKFGGDFLVYLGDPLLFHASYIVRCVENPDRLHHPSEVVAFGRLGTSVKKKTVLAAMDAEDNKVNYITLSWMEAQ